MLSDTFSVTIQPPSNNDDDIVCKWSPALMTQTPLRPTTVTDNKHDLVKHSTMGI